MAYESATHDGMTVESSSQTAEQIREVFDVPETPVAEAPETPAEPETPVAEAKGKPRNDPRARVEQATAKEAEAKRLAAAAEERAAKAEARIAELEARSRPEPAKPPAQPPQVDAEPTVDQFDSYEKFVKAQARWEARQEIRQQEQVRQQHEALQAREHAIREVDRQFGERYNAVLAEDPEFPTKVDPRLLNTPRAGVLRDPTQATFGNFLVEQVFQSEHPKELLLHLSNPEEVQRLATLPPARVIRELAIFEARLDAASPRGPAPTVPPVSKAKAPIQPLGSSHVTAPDSEPGDDAPFEKHKAYWDNADRKLKRA